MELTPLSNLQGSVNLPLSQFIELLESHKLRLKEKESSEKEGLSLETSVVTILRVVLDNITDKTLLGGIPNPLLILVNSELESINHQVYYKSSETLPPLILGSLSEDSIKIDLNKYL